MRKVLVLVPLEKRHRDRLEGISDEFEFMYTEGELPEQKQLEEANVIIGNLPAAMADGAKKLELLQLSKAGAEDYAKRGKLPGGARVANASGSYGEAISEFMLAILLTLTKRIDLYLENKKKHEWKWENGRNCRAIYGSRTLVVGMGDIGGQFARKMNALGSTVVGIRNHPSPKPEYAEAVYTMEGLDDQLPKADFVACALPGSPETFHLFDRERLGRMKKGAVLINVGRGSLIESEVLADALKTGILGGACLDVADQEPLPSDSPLWDAPNLILTPHVSGASHLEETQNRFVEITARNLERLLEGKPILNEVDYNSGYRKVENRA